MEIGGGGSTGLANVSRAAHIFSALPFKIRARVSERPGVVSINALPSIDSVAQRSFRNSACCSTTQSFPSSCNSHLIAVGGLPPHFARPEPSRRKYMTLSVSAYRAAAFSAHRVARRQKNSSDRNSRQRHRTNAIGDTSKLHPNHGSIPFGVHQQSGSSPFPPVSTYFVPRQAKNGLIRVL